LSASDTPSLQTRLRAQPANWRYVLPEGLITLLGRK
jgi:hypothetical protein